MKQGEIWMANLDPTRGSEQAGFRPILVFSGDLFNTHTPLIIGLPLSSKIKNYRGNLILEPDPENGLIYVFLSNRVYPDASNKLLVNSNVRTNIHDVIYDAVRKANLDNVAMKHGE